MVSRDPADIVVVLQGTCKSLGDVLTDEEQHDRALLEVIDQEIFLCSCCEWWCENGAESSVISFTCVECGGGDD